MEGDVATLFLICAYFEMSITIIDSRRLMKKYGLMYCQEDSELSSFKKTHALWIGVILE